jgi:hypothetical protein
MKAADVYVDLDGNGLALDGLDDAERRLIARLRRRARTHPDWCDFSNYYQRALAEFAKARRLARKAVARTAAFRIAQDLCSRLGLAEGHIRPDDYLSDLEDLVRSKFPSQRAFCDATGIAPDMLSHVLAGRKDLSLEALTRALERIGYRLRIAPALDLTPTAQKQTG